MNIIQARLFSLNEFRDALKINHLEGSGILNQDTFRSMMHINREEYTKCPWCATKNKSDEPSCVRCGGPLG